MCLNLILHIWKISTRTDVAKYLYLINQKNSNGVKMFMAEQMPSWRLT